MGKESKPKIFRFSFASNMCICVTKWMDNNKTNESLFLSLSLLLLHSHLWILYWFVFQALFEPYHHCIPDSNDKIYNNITILGNAYVLRATIGSPLWLGSLYLSLRSRPRLLLVDCGSDGDSDDDGGASNKCNRIWIHRRRETHIYTHATSHTTGQTGVANEWQRKLYVPDHHQPKRLLFQCVSRVYGQWNICSALFSLNLMFDLSEAVVVSLAILHWWCQLCQIKRYFG